MERNERSEEAYRMRKEGSTFKEIGERFGVSVERARQLVFREERRLSLPEHWMNGLSVRTQNCLKSEGYYEKDSVIRAFEQGGIDSPPDHDIRRIPNFGKKSLAELRAHLGLGEPEKKRGAESLKIRIEQAIRLLERNGYKVIKSG